MVKIHKDSWLRKEPKPTCFIGSRRPRPCRITYEGKYSDFGLQRAYLRQWEVRRSWRKAPQDECEVAEHEHQGGDDGRGTESEPLLYANDVDDNSDVFADQPNHGDSGSSYNANCSGAFSRGAPWKFFTAEKNAKEKARELRWKESLFCSLFTRLFFIIPVIVKALWPPDDDVDDDEVRQCCASCSVRASIVVCCEACSRSCCWECDRKAHSTMHQHSRQEHFVENGRLRGLDAEEFIIASGYVHAQSDAAHCLQPVYRGVQGHAAGSKVRTLVCIFGVFSRAVTYVRT